MTKYGIFKEADLPLEAVILLIAGVPLLVTGVLLFLVSSETLPYYENDLYGLLLVVFTLQMITWGKTHFSDLHKSIPLVTLGAGIAVAAIMTCFIPDMSSRISRLLLFVCFSTGGLLTLIKICVPRLPIGMILTVHGGVLLYLLRILTVLDKIDNNQVSEV